MLFSEIAGDSGIFVDGDWIEKKDQDPNGKVRLIQLADIGEGHFLDKSNRFITESKAEELHCTFLKKGDILIARLGEPLCKACVFPYEGLYITAVDIAILRIGSDRINPEYIIYLVNSPWFKEAIKQYESGTTRKRISRKNLNRIDIDIPSIAKQNQIVTQIEESLSQLDSAVETLKKTKQQLEVYRQAVLREVFSRCEQSVEIKTVCKHVTDGDHMPPPKAETGIPFIMISNINGNTIDWSDTSFVGKEYYNTIGDKRTPQKGDVLYTVTGSFGIPVLIDFEKEFCFQRHIALLRPNEKIEQEFLYFALQDSTVYAQASKRATGTAQKTVGLTVLRTINIPFTESKEKQTEMVSIIKSRLTQCDMVENTVNQSVQQAEALRQSILKQAFEGE